MARCPSCREEVYGERERIGARCPHCRQPLYEAPRDPRRGRTDRPVSADAAHCVEHAGNLAVGSCQRCGNFACMVCWTRWYGRSLCAACVRRGVAARDAVPEQTRAHKRQATLALVFGLLAWGGLLLGGVLVLAALPGTTSARPEPEPWRILLILLAWLLWLPTPLVSLFGVGQGAAAIRCRGDHMVIATVGLVMSGLHIGVVVGIMVAGTISTVREHWSVGLPPSAPAAVARFDAPTGLSVVPPQSKAV